MQPEKVIMAFDFGLARTGVAIGNTLVREAKPVGIIYAKTNEERWKAIGAMVAEWQQMLLLLAFLVMVTVLPMS